MNDLHTIVYVSTAVSLFSDADLKSLLVEARERNRKHGVTGVLLYGDGNFVQCIEGQKASLETIYGRIAASRRHKGIVELLNEPVAERSFADWQLGFSQPTPEQCLALSTAKWQAHYERAPGVAKESDGMALLRDFWRRSGH